MVASINDRQEQLDKLGWFLELALPATNYSSVLLLWQYEQALGTRR